MKKLPDLEAWAIFAKVAEQGSFARAAAELGVSQATISKAVTRLEQRIGISLFHRTSRRMSLTASGEDALERANRILDEGEAVEQEVAERSHSLRGPIRVGAPMSFGISQVAQALPAFMREHPQVRLDVQLSDEMVDVVGGGFDVVLRISNLGDSSLLARRMCTVRRLLVGAPAYFEQHGRPKHPRDLARHVALQYSYFRGGTTWRFRHQRHGEFAQAMHTQLESNNADVFLPALRAGLGLALQPEFLVWQDLQSGALETAMPEWTVDPIALHAVTPPGRRRPARVQALIDFFVASFAEAPWVASAGSKDDVAALD